MEKVDTQGVADLRLSLSVFINEIRGGCEFKLIALRNSAWGEF